MSSGADEAGIKHVTSLALVPYPGPNPVQHAMTIQKFIAPVCSWLVINDLFVTPADPFSYSLQHSDDPSAFQVWNSAVSQRNQGNMTLGLPLIRPDVLVVVQKQTSQEPIQQEPKNLASSKVETATDTSQASSNLQSPFINQHGMRN